MIVDRIRQIIDYKDISVRQFCINVGIANGFLDKVKDVGSEKVLKILNAYPEINPIWLLMGEGSMLKEPVPPAVSSSPPQENDNEVIALLKENNDNLKKINTLQEEKIKGLEKEVAQLKEDLELYIANSSGDILKSNAG